MSFPPAPDPETALGRLRILSPTCSVRVSPLQLGAMSIGEAWSGRMGSLDKQRAFELMDAFVQAGGNFIDTANNYQNEQSETWIGEWMAARGNRDQLVIATKYSTDYRSHQLGGGKTPLHVGNGKRSMHLSVRDSLKKLQTDWIDILYVHWWDHVTSIEEMMDGLDEIVKQGKVLYLGISDSPAWVVAAANTYARARGKTPFSIYQGRWNVLERDLERDIIPMARHFGMALAPWGVLVAGRMASRKTHEVRQAAGEKVRKALGRPAALTETEWKMVDVLEEIAREVGLDDNVPAIAIAYVMSKAPYVFPIIGGRKTENLVGNIKALDVRLSKEQIKRIEEVHQFDVGFPHNLIGMNPQDGNDVPFLLRAAAVEDYVQREKAIGY